MTLILKQLSAGYGSGAVLHQIDLQVGPGEIVALVGANGAGKSTMVRTISGLLEASAGEIWFDGERIDRLASGERVRRGIAHVPEGRQVFPDMTVRENLRLGAYVHQPRQSDAVTARQIDGLCARFPVLAPRLNDTAGNLSGGQQQILAIARGLMAAPKLLILDEPSLGVSPVLVQEIFSLIGQLREDGIAVLLSEQNARQSLAIADRGYVIANGRVATEGDARALLQSEEIAARYLGGAPASSERNREHVAQLAHRLKTALSA
jgi:branched-chain amino acid transport system ATP-binding protein